MGHRPHGARFDRLVRDPHPRRLTSASAAALRDGHDTMYAEYWERLTPLPRAVDLLRACAARGLRVVLATSAAEHEVAALRATLGADDVIDTVTSSADAQESKPAPDILVAALDQSGLAAERVVYDDPAALLDALDESAIAALG
ncbi:HAD family hydrolase [Micromonospora sp. SL4-19]|uniref:HAD family hydrolase n=1 Tax=Micromonospora sp. SL4-19 TaxID=3399129 RepID=UPI003A4E6430